MTGRKKQKQKPPAHFLFSNFRLTFAVFVRPERTVAFCVSNCYLNKAMGNILESKCLSCGETANKGIVATTFHDLLLPHTVHV